MNYNVISEKYGLEVATLKAVMDVESAGRGFFTDWKGMQRIKIQFEPHVFARELSKRNFDVRLEKTSYGYMKLWIDGLLVLENKVDKQLEEWRAFNIAARYDLESAMLATSWGLGQVMGFNYKLAGYENVGDMVDAFKESEEKQFEGMLSFILNRKIMKHLKKKNWRLFAKYYNGVNYRKYNYHKRLEKAYERYRNIGASTGE